MAKDCSVMALRADTPVRPYFSILSLLICIATFQFSPFTFQFSALYNKKDESFWNSSFHKKWRWQCETVALLATTEPLGLQRSAFRPQLSHKPVYRFDNSCSDWSRAVWQSHTAWVAISRDCQMFKEPKIEEGN